MLAKKCILDKKEFEIYAENISEKLTKIDKNLQK